MEPIELKKLKLNWNWKWSKGDWRIHLRRSILLIFLSLNFFPILFYRFEMEAENQAQISDVLRKNASKPSAQSIQSSSATERTASRSLSSNSPNLTIPPEMETEPIEEKGWSSLSRWKARGPSIQIVRRRGRIELCFLCRIQIRVHSLSYRILYLTLDCWIQSTWKYRHDDDCQLALRSWTSPWL